MTDISERQPIGDYFSGYLIQVGDMHALSSEKPDDEIQVIQRGTFIIRYGVPFLGKPHLSIVPGLIALDYGEVLAGEEAWDFLLNRSNLYPRADVIGYRNDGEDDMVVVKWLDVDQPVHILVYPDEAAIKPIAEVFALITEDEDDMPPRLLKHLRFYRNINKWQLALADE